jgi:hypothetical protein
MGITVFHAIALGEALEHNGATLDSKTQARWTDRLARAARFLDGFIPIETGNINYPVTSSEEQVNTVDAKSVEIKKHHGTLVIHTNSAAGFLPIPADRTITVTLREAKI